MTGLVRQSQFSVATCSAMSALCRACSARSGYSRDMYGEVGFVSGRVRPGRVCAAKCSSKSSYCRDVFGEVVLVSVRVRGGFLVAGRVRIGLVSVGTCSARSA